MQSMDLVGEAAAAQRRDAAQVGEVAAAKQAAVGTADAGTQAQAQREGWQALQERAQQGGEAATAPLAPEAAAEARGEETAGGAAPGGQVKAVQAAVERQDAGASKAEQDAAAEAALREAEEREAAGGNLWARALAAAGAAGTAAAIAAAVSSAGV